LVVLSAAGALRAADAAAEREAARYVTTLRRETKDPAELAERILVAAGAVEENLPFQIALYEKAYEQGMRVPGDCRAAIRAAGKLLEVAPKENARWRGHLVKAYERQFTTDKSRRADAGRKLLGLYLEMCDEHLAAGESDKASAVLKQTDRIVRITGSPRKSEIAERREVIAATKKVQSQVRLYRARLKMTPGDQRCRLDLLRLYVVELDDPAAGMEVLTADVDETWRTYVPLAAQAPGTLKEAACLELGHWYWQHAEEPSVLGRGRMQKRAGVYYRRFLSLHVSKDADYLTAKMRVEEIEKATKRAKRVAFGMVKHEVTTVKKMGAYTCKVWRILPDHATGTSYRVSIKHAVAGANGAFRIIAFTDRNGDGTPDALIGTSLLQRASVPGQWSSWTFETKHKAVFVGNTSTPSLKSYYAMEDGTVEYVGLSSTMYYSDRGKIPTQMAAPRYTNIRVEVLK